MAIFDGQLLRGRASAAKPVPARRTLALLLPALAFHAVYWTVAAVVPVLPLYTARSETGHPYWFVSVTMVFGSLFAGATAEGGGAIAFPVLTLLFSVLPAIARDFSFLVQSCGMTAAAFSIWYMRVAVEPRAVRWCTLGGMAGVALGLELVDGHMAPVRTKMYFVCCWFAFAMTLIALNSMEPARRVHTAVTRWSAASAGVLLATGAVGGVVTALAGSGIDISVFAVLTLYYRVNEKVATPTSVVIMAANSVFGAAYRQLAMGGVHPEAVRYLAVCVPIVTVGAPLGAVLGSHLHRRVLANGVFFIDVAQLVGALAIVRPWEVSAELCVSSAGVFFGVWAIVAAMTRLGRARLDGDVVSAAEFELRLEGAGTRLPLPPPPLAAGGIPAGIAAADVEGVSGFAIVLDGVLSAAECAAMAATAEATGWEPALVNVGGGMQLKMTESRLSDRAIVDDTVTAAALWARCSAHVPATFKGCRPAGLNERLRFLRYGEGQYFKPHRDGSYKREGERSLMTVMVYLNTCGGGRTTFHDPEGGLVAAVEPRPGRVLIFDHPLLHSGETVSGGVKVCVRTDVMFVPEDGSVSVSTS